MPQPTIDQEKCIACGQCVATCPSFVFRKVQGRVEVNPETAGWCFPCAQCMAVCPTEAVTANGLDYAGFGDLPTELPDAAGLERLFLTRRSVRHFRKDPVSREDLEQVLRVAVTAPFGVPPNDVEIAVFSTRAQIEAILPPVIEGCEGFIKQLKNPIGGFFIRRAMGPEMFDALEEHLLPLIPPMCQLYREKGIDCATWGAPAMLLFHATRRSCSGRENCLIACTYAMLAAHSLGLGTTMVGIVPPIIDQSKPLREKLGIPEGNACVISLIVGHPAPKYRRTIPRKFTSVTWLD